LLTEIGPPLHTGHFSAVLDQTRAPAAGSNFAL
jgi:hypothetical protein